MSAAMPDIAVPTRPFTARLLELLRVFDGCRGSIDIDMRSLSGIGQSALSVRPPVAAIPFPLLDAIRDNDGTRFTPVTRAGGLQDLAIAFVCWRPAQCFDASTGWRYTIAPDAQERIREALAAFALPPAQLIDAGPEVVALWLLEAPLAVDRDPARALALLVGLAERLAGDVTTAQDLGALLPLCGVIRNWNHELADHVDVVDVEPGRRYPVEQLEAALASPQPAEAATPRRKKGVQG